MAFLVKFKSFEIMDTPVNNGFPDNIVMGEVDYSNLPYIISLFVLILSLRKLKVSTSEVMSQLKFKQFQ